MPITTCSKKKVSLVKIVFFSSLPGPKECKMPDIQAPLPKKQATKAVAGCQLLGIGDSYPKEKHFN